MQRIDENKLKRLEAESERFSREVKLKKAENERLREQVTELKAKIKKSRETFEEVRRQVGGRTRGEQKSAMREIMTSRKLANETDAREKEISRLRHELKRQRMKTFPKFNPK